MTAVPVTPVAEAVIVTANVPAVAGGAAVSAMALVSAAGLGEKVAVIPAGRPPALNVTGPVKLPLRVKVRGYGSDDWPWPMNTRPPPTPMATPGGRTTSVAVAVWVSDPLVAVTVSGKLPGGVAVEVDTTRVDAALLAAGLMVAVAPGGKPATVSDGVPANPPNGVSVM